MVSSFVVKDNTMDELVVTWNMPNLWTANPSATPSYTYTITNVLSGSTDTYTNNLNVPSASGTDQTFTQKVTPTISGSGARDRRPRQGGMVSLCADQQMPKASLALLYLCDRSV